MRRSLLLLTAFAAACGDTPFSTDRQTDLQGSLQATNAEGHFSFLAPIDPAPQYIGDPFNPDVVITIEVCAVDEAGACADTLSFSVGESPDDNPDNGVVAVENESLYWWNWKVRGQDATSGQLVPAGDYRISVRTGPSNMGGRELGGVRVTINNAGAGRFTRDDGEFHDVESPLATIPVKFRVEVGALCTTLEPDDDLEPCLEARVDGAGGEFVTRNEQAGVLIPAGAIGDGIARNLIIERYESEFPGDACLPTPFPQFGGCYRYLLEPQLAEFSEEVTVGICPDDPALYPFQQQLDLMKWDEQDPSTLVPLERRVVEFLECDGWPEDDGGVGEGPVHSRLGALLQGIFRFLGPAPVYANFRGISPFGGGLHDFSRMGWVRPLALEKVSGDVTDAGTGQTITATVRVIADGMLMQGEPAVGVADASVSFMPGTGTSANPLVATSDADGFASTQWTLGSSLGNYSLRARGFNPAPPEWPNLPGPWGDEVEFLATVVPGADFAAVVLQPVQNGTANGPHLRGLDVRVEICQVAGASCNTVAVMAGAEIDSKPQFYQTAWKSPRDLPTGAYELRVLVDGVIVGTVQMAAGGDRKSVAPGTYVFNPGQNVPIRFTVGRT